MPSPKGVKQKVYACKRSSKADMHRKRAAQGRTLDSLQAGMGAFLGRSSSSHTREDDAFNKRQRILPLLGSADIRIEVATNEEGKLWEQIYQRDRDYTVRQNQISDKFDSTTNSNDGGCDSDSDDKTDEGDHYDINVENGEYDERDYESDIEEMGTPKSLNNCVMRKYLNAIKSKLNLIQRSKHIR